jgi:hypothetical protein
MKYTIFSVVLLVIMLLGCNSSHWPISEATKNQKEDRGQLIDVRVKVLKFIPGYLAFEAVGGENSSGFDGRCNAAILKVERSSIMAPNKIIIFFTPDDAESDLFRKQGAYLSFKIYEKDLNESAYQENGNVPNENHILSGALLSVRSEPPSQNQ